MHYKCVVAAIVLGVISVLAAGCSHRSCPCDARLQRVAILCDADYAAARACLDSVDRGSLSADDSHFYDFFSLKLDDKEYIEHTSDSLVLALIDYASKHKDAHYAETLYYGGRVYSDLGDYPTALQYFQEAIDALPDECTTSALNSHILSQTGRLLDNLGLQSEARPYVERALAVDRARGDSLDEVYNLQLLGHIFLASGQYEQADSCYRATLEKKNVLQPTDIAKTMVYLAAIKYEEEQYDSAINLIRGMPAQVSPVVRDNANAYCAEIYYMADMPDSAYAYARGLVDNPESANREIGYHILLAPDMRGYSPLDTLNGYLYDYSRLLESYYNDNDNRLALTQQALYNYQLQERRRIKAEAANSRLRMAITGIVVLMLVFLVIVLFWKNRVKAEMLSLRRAIADLDRLQGRPADTQPESVHALREQLEKRLNQLSADSTSASVPESILVSDAYRRLQEIVKERRALRDDEDIWAALEAVVIECSPKFKESLTLLTGGSLTEQEYRTALLIKCGCQPLQMATLFGRTKGTIVSRRESISQKAFGRKLGTKAIDTIIRML